MDYHTCSRSYPLVRDQPDQYKEAEQLCFEGGERVRRLARPMRHAAARLATAEAMLQAVSRDIDVRGALVCEIEALDKKVEEMARARRDAMGKGGEDLFVEIALQGLEARCAEKEAYRAIAAAKLVALRSIEPDARLEEREALALSTRELSRAGLKRAVDDFNAATSRVLLSEWVKAIVESWFAAVQGEIAGDQAGLLS